ncbi:MAG: hypothetical protein EOM14_16430 [Clostridia bacterium]|nr:hypothetical protein [Clostridia bacterium]
MLQQEVVSPVAALIPGKFNALPGNRGTFYAKSIAANGDLEEVWVTYREGDPAGVGARAFYRALGFVPGENLEMFGYPCQKLTVTVPDGPLGR